MEALSSVNLVSTIETSFPWRPCLDREGGERLCVCIASGTLSHVTCMQVSDLVHIDATSVVLFLRPHSNSPTSWLGPMFPG